LLEGIVAQQRGEGSPFTSRPTTYSDPARGGGQLYTQMTHAASLLLFVTGIAPRQVMAYANHRGLPVDVADVLAISMEDGSIATLSTTGTVATDARGQEEYRVFGSHGHALLDTARGTLTLAVRDREVVEEGPIPPNEAQPSRATSASLVATALGKSAVVASGEIGARTVDLLAAAAESARTGRPVPVGQAVREAPDRGAVVPS
jgi:predicted dehydrogenase